MGKLQREIASIEAPAPTAIEAPHLLPRFEEPKPFVHPKRLQAFSASVFIGAACMGGVYYLLSRTLAEFAQNEVNTVAAMVPKPKASAVPTLPKFVAPSSYRGLVDKLEAAGGEVKPLANSQEPARRTVLLHEEMLRRSKLKWNDTIADMQSALEMYTLQLRQYREAQAKLAIRRSLEERGYVLKELREVRL